jgi:HlyD family secretion protein
MERTRLELEAAEKDLERVQQLSEAGAATPVEVEKAQLQVDAYRQTLQEQTAQIDAIRAQAAGFEKTLQQLDNKAQQLIIKSPIDGIVLNLPVEIEQAAYPGSLLVSVGISDQLEVRAELLSDDMSAVKVGQKVLITAPVLGDKALTGEIKQIYPQAEEKQSALGVIQRRVPVIITLPQPDLLKPGYEVKAAIETLRQDNVLLLNREAVRTLANNQKEVMVVADGRIQHRIIETGINDRTQVVVTSGLAAGEPVVKDGSLVFKEGAKVRLKTAE